MEEIRQIARAYYKTSPKDVQESAKVFFEAMDINRDGMISLHEFQDFMTQQRYKPMSDPRLFEEINGDNSGYLNFDDVKVLYYIVVSGKPFCRWCDKLIVGAYFTCVKCFESDLTEMTFCLHPSCYEKQPHGIHNIHGHNEFVDNHVMLHQLRLRGIRRVIKTA